MFPSNKASLDSSLRLRRAAAAGRDQEIKQILNGDEQFNINDQSSNGNTALHWAAQGYYNEKDNSSKERYKEIILQLISFDADDTILNKENLSIYQIITKNKVKEPNSVLVALKIARESFVKETKKIYPEKAAPCAAMCAHFFAHLLLLPLDQAIQLHWKDKKIIEILSLGCGLCLDALALRKFAKLFGKDIQYYGVDINTQYAQEISVIYPDTVFPIAANANDLPALQEKLRHKQFAFGLLRNPGLTEDNECLDTFQQMIDVTFPELLVNDAIFLATFGQEKELLTFSKKKSIRSDSAFYLKQFEGNVGDFSEMPIMQEQDGGVVLFDSYSVLLSFNEQKYQQYQLGPTAPLIPAP